MSLARGTRLEHYEIVEPLGAGGMGEVYRAQDTRLRREVAIKILPPQFAADPGRLARFEREAQVLAALNHPNIAAIYGIEQAGGIRFLVLELVEGPTLAQRVSSGAIPLEESLNVGKQIADALGAAHDKGIVHRDIKPANVKVTPDGAVKVLDFGLAAMVQPQLPESTDPTNSPTLTMGATQAGVIIGTAGYMSPEQARGSNVDKRADIWGFGVVLHEMVTGRRLFQGDTVSDTLASVLKEQPDLDSLPVKVRRLIQKCLEKDPKKRLRDIGDAWELLDGEQHAGMPPQSEGLFKKRLAWAVAGVALLALAALSFIHFREKPQVRELARFVIPAPPGTTFGDASNFVLSPDGRKIAFLATGVDRRQLIWIRSLDAEEARPLADTEDVTGAPFWSPDSRYLAFGSGGKLKKIEVAGGPAQTLCDASLVFGGTWTSDNRILFGTPGPLQLVSAAGGIPIPLTILDRSRNDEGHLGPTMLPDGHHFLYLRLSVPYENGGVYIGSLDAKPEQQNAKRLLPGATIAVYVPSPLTGDSPGLLLFMRGLTSATSPAGTLMAQPFDPKRSELKGDALPIAERVTYFSVSPAGVLAFSTAEAQSKTRLTWYDRKGNVQSTAGEPGDYAQLSLSPDGGRLIYSVGDTGLWLFEFARDITTKLTFGNPAYVPSWSADGSRIIFTSPRTSVFGIYQVASNGAGQEELLYQSPEAKGFASWTRDGRFVLYNSFTPERLTDLMILPTGGSAADRKPVPLRSTQFSEALGRFSPDNRWIAFWSDQSGKSEVYVLPFDESSLGSPAAAGGVRQISIDGGDDPHWRGDGKELFYMAPDGYLMAADVSVVSGALQSGAPRRLFKSPATNRGTWDVAADGKRFLIAAPANAAGSAADPDSQSLHVVVNWTAMLRR